MSNDMKWPLGHLDNLQQNTILGHFIIILDRSRAWKNLELRYIQTKLEKRWFLRGHHRSVPALTNQPQLHECTKEKRFKMRKYRLLDGIPTGTREILYLNARKYIQKYIWKYIWKYLQKCIYKFTFNQILTGRLSKASIIN